MRTKFSGILTLLLAFVVQVTLAQGETISGTVTDNSGLPLPGVNVVVKNTTNGTQTDFDGNYTITANRGAVISFSYVGFSTREVVVGDNNNISVQLLEDAAVLDEVIVTAQGIAREKRSLGYSISTIKEEDLEDRPEGDLGRLLRGKAAGINITASNGISGSATNIIIRGLNSITGNNQPLFVVNGVPFDGGTNDQGVAFFDGQNESSRFLDLDPNSIESVNVLKGLSASVLYGERGRNGVILITTKNAGTAGVSKKKTEISVSQSTFISEAILPEYQDEYGGGFHQNFGFFFSNHGASFREGTLSNATLELNPRFIRRDENGIVLLDNPLSRLNDQTLTIGFEDIANSEYPYVPYDSVDEFFRTGFVSNTSVNVRGSGEKVSYNVNYGNLEDKGFTPGNTLRRNTFGVGGNAILSNKFSVNAAINFSRTDYKTPPVAASAGSGTIGDGASVFGDVLYTPRSVDLFGLPFQASDGRSVYYRSGNDIQNPRWTAVNAKATQQTDRMFSNFTFNYQLNDWMTATYRLGLDTYTELNTYGQNKGGVDGDVTGIYRTTSVRNTTWDHSLIFNAKKDLTTDLSLEVVAGLTSRRDAFERDGVESTGQVVFGVLEHYNFLNASTINSFTQRKIPIAFRREVNTLGAYLDASFNYKSFLYLNGAIRQDWTSTLESDNLSIVYPGGSISFIPTEAFEGMSSDGGLNYLKLRFGYGQSAGFPPPYSTRPALVLTARAFVDAGGNPVSSNNIDRRLENPNLKPELISEFEAGIDSRFLNNRLGLNVSIFKRITKDLITDRNFPTSAGFEVQRVNAGELENEGIEVDFNIDAFKNRDGFSWTINGNFYADEPIVTQLDNERIALTSTIANRPANWAVEGLPLGVLLGTKVVRTNGQFTVDSNGDYVTGPSSTEVLGDPNPDWTGAVTNTFGYKGFSFSMDWQYRNGGDVYSQTSAALVGRGVVDADNPLDREQTYILPGVQADGSPNTVQLSTTRIYFNNLGFGANEHSIYDGTTLRLSEVSLGYNFSEKMLKSTPFGALSIKLSGSNLWYKAFNFPDDVKFDTNSLSTGAGNGQGIDFFTGPSARRYGFTVSATF